MAFCHTAPGSKPLQRRTFAEASLAPLPAAVALGHASVPVHTCKSTEHSHHASRLTCRLDTRGINASRVSASKPHASAAFWSQSAKLRQDCACRIQNIFRVPIRLLQQSHSYGLAHVHGDDEAATAAGEAGHSTHLSTGRLCQCRIVALLHVLEPECIENRSAVRRPQQLYCFRAICNPLSTAQNWSTA